MAAAETRPFAPFEWMLALRYLRARRKEGFISVIAGFSFIGIMLGVATLIIVMSVMNGFRKELFDKILGLNGHGIIRPLGRDFTDYRESAQRLQAVAGVKAAIPVVEGQVLMTTPAASGGVYVRGIREADLRKLEGVSSNVVSGSLDGFDSGDGIAIGSRLADTLKVRVGGAVALVSRSGGSDSLPSDTATRVKRYPVRAIFKIGMAEYDMTIGFLPLGEAQKYFNLPDVAHVLEVFVDDPDSIDTMRRPLLTASGPDMLMTDWRERNASFHNMLQVQRDVLFLILTLIVLVAALNIISGLIMLVKDKGRDIAILRTMGATRGAMMRVFFVTGASIGIAGTLGGLLLGVLVSLNIDSIRKFLSWVTATDLFPSTIYFLSYLPAKVDAGEVASIVIMAISLSMLATLYPSWRAARLEPVEALRYE